MYYPDKNTKWKSQAEMLDAHQERNSRGQKRYEVDEAFRAACEAKTGLGFEDSDGPSIRTDSGVVDSVNGRRDSSLKIQFDDRDAFVAQETARLTGEIKDAQERLTYIEPQADRDARDNALIASIEAVMRGAAPTPFTSPSDMTRAMGHERYRRDPYFNAAVAARAALGVPGITATVSDNGSRSQQA